MASSSKPPLGGHKARKRFGQNFLIDHGIINAIVRAVSPRATDNIVEIGPGQGAITAHLIDGCPTLDVIELDRDLVPILLAQFVSHPGFKIHQTDALKFDFASLTKIDEKLRVVGNLPYNISTPLIFHLLSYENRILDMHFMLQKEVVLRLAASPGEKNYGRLSVMTQYLCDVENLFEVPPESFQPMPKVDSAIVRLTPHTKKPFVVNNVDKFAMLVKTCFAQRRKTLRNNLKQLFLDLEIDAETISEQLNLDLSRRGESLSLEEYVNLCNCIWS